MSFARSPFSSSAAPPSLGQKRTSLSSMPVFRGFAPTHRKGNLQTQRFNKRESLSVPIHKRMSVIFPDRRIEFKVVLCGDSGVGKTSFLRRLEMGDFITKHVPTKGVSEEPLKFTTNVGPVHFECYDLADSPKYENFIPEYLAGAKAAIIMFDVTSQASYNSLNKWFKLIQRYCKNIPIVICGNKVDLKKKRCVLPKDTKFHLEKGLQYYSLSVKNWHNLEKPFLYITRKLCGAPQALYSWEHATPFPALPTLDAATLKEWNREIEAARKVKLPDDPPGLW